MWNPTVSVLKRWIEICMAQKWAHPNSGKTVCMSPLDLTGEEILDEIVHYANDSGKQVKELFEDPTIEHQKQIADQIIIPA